MSEATPSRKVLDEPTAQRASRSWWDAEADDYHAEHGAFLGDADFVWCPERVREADAQLLGDVTGATVLEVGCGGAPCARWLTAHGVRTVAFDLSAGMLRHAAALNDRTSLRPPLVQADATELPFRDGAFDVAFAAFGAVPHVASSASLQREVFRVLKPGGRWVFSTPHPMRWVFPDDPGEAGLTAVQSYFDRRPYVEVTGGEVSYVEQHRTIGDRIRELTLAGFVIDDLVEPSWPEELTEEWGQWSPLRGELFPGTAIWSAHKPG